LSQAYFTHDIGLPLTMTPNYEDFSCTLTFRATPPSHDRDLLNPKPETRNLKP
jgi:hypothetical protein